MQKPSRIMIFGRPGSGKSTIALKLHSHTQIPVYHLDQYFYVANWQERPYEDFLSIQQSLVEKDSWIIDGNCIDSLEMRYAQADMILYFKLPRWLCLARVLKRFFKKNRKDPLAQGCKETVKFKVLKYMWNFEKRVEEPLELLKERYPSKPLVMISCSADIKKIEEHFNVSLR